MHELCFVRIASHTNTGAVRGVLTEGHFGERRVGLHELVQEVVHILSYTGLVPQSILSVSVGEA